MQPCATHRHTHTYTHTHTHTQNYKANLTLSLDIIIGEKYYGIQVNMKYIFKGINDILLLNTEAACLL